MSWDAVVVTCPKQSWVASIREEVAIALNQVAMVMVMVMHHNLITLITMSVCRVAILLRCW